MADKEEMREAELVEHTPRRTDAIKNDKHKKLIIIGSIVGVLVILGCIGTGFAVASVVGRLHQQRMNNGSQSSYGLSQNGFIGQNTQQGQGSPRRYRQFGGGSATQTGDFAEGVVISVNGDSFVVAGNGKQVTVDKTSSTTLNGTSNTTVSVNDTVSVQGTTTNGVLNATSITIRNLQVN